MTHPSVADSLRRESRPDPPIGRHRNRQEPANRPRPSPALASVCRAACAEHPLGDRHHQPHARSPPLRHEALRTMRTRGLHYSQLMDDEADSTPRNAPSGWHPDAADASQRRHVHGHRHRRGRGWYPDPADASQWRFWDGYQWTDQVAPRDSNRRAPATGTTGTEGIERGIEGHIPIASTDPTGLPPASEPPHAAGSEPHGLPLASRWRRLAARAIDLVCLLAVAYVLTTMASRHIDVGPSEASLDWWLTWIVLWFFWEFAPPAFTGRTLGKAVLGIRIIRGDDSASDRFLAAFVRSVGWIVPFAFQVSCITIFGKKRRTIPDMLARTSVVRHAPVQALRVSATALMIMILAASASYSYLSVWREVAMIGNEWEPLSAFVDADQIRAEALREPDTLGYDMVVFRNTDTPIWDLVYFTGDSEDEETLMDELWDDFLMIDCYWYREDASGSPGIAFDWPQLASSSRTDVELSWRASTGASGQAVGLMNYESQDVGGAWIATAGLTEDGIADNLRESGLSPDETGGVPIVTHDFYQALLEADRITLTAGATSNTWDLPEDSSSLRSLVERCEEADAQDSSPGEARSSKESSNSEASTEGALPGGVDLSGRSATSACEFSDRSATVRGAVFQVSAGSGIGTAFYVGNDEWITAAHVVENQRSVILRNGTTELSATVKGGDLVADLALLEAAGNGITPFRFGSLGDVGAGSTVYAIGFPLYEATESSVTSGVLSKVEQYEDLGEVIVTDASVNPGNSGGPLVDACGDVIGLIIAKHVSTDVEGIGYAVAETTLQDQIPSLRTAGPDSIAGSRDYDASINRGGDTNGSTEEGWIFGVDANIEGGYEYYLLEAVWHSGDTWQDSPALILRCSTTGTSSLDSLFVWTPFLILNDLNYDSSTVRYRFENMTAAVTERSWWSSQESDSWLFAPEGTSFAEHLGRAGSGRLYMEFIPGSPWEGGVESAEFIVDGTADVLRALNCW